MNGKLFLVGAGAAVVLIFVMYKLGGKAVEAAKAALPYVNPADEHNLVNQAVLGVGSAITGDKDWSLGSQIYDWTHAEFDPNAPIVKKVDYSAGNPLVTPTGMDFSAGNF